MKKKVPGGWRAPRKVREVGTCHVGTSNKPIKRVEEGVESLGKSGGKKKVSENRRFLLDVFVGGHLSVDREPLGLDHTTPGPSDAPSARSTGFLHFPSDLLTPQ